MIYFMNRINRAQQAFLISLLSLSILSCGGGSTTTSSGISGTGISSGSITGFGSIFVNGIEYDIEGASFEVDGQTGTIIDNGDLQLGMVVKLENVTDNGDGTGVATSVIYEDAIDGPVTTIPVFPAGDTNLRQFEVMGLPVIINATTTTFESDVDVDFGFDTLAEDDLIEVSGFAGQSGDIIATRVEKTGVLTVGNPNDTDVEIHGLISQIVSPTDIIVNVVNVVNGITVHLDNETILVDIASNLQVGLFVEVEGKFVVVDGSINADIIEGEDDDRDEITNATGDVSLQGLISGYVSNSNFMVNGFSINASSFTGLLADGLEVEVKGEFISDVLIADTLEIRSGDADFTAFITSVDNIATNSISIGYPAVNGEITLNFDSQSKLVDETGAFDPLTLQDLTVDMTVKVEARKDGVDWLVTSLKIVDNNEELEIEGVVTAKSLIDLRLTINSLVLTLDPAADYETKLIENATAKQFFDAITVGTTRVELENADSDVLGLFESAEID